MPALRDVASLATLFVALAIPASAGADALDDLTLPQASKAPWRFKGFPIVGFWGPPGTATRADFQAYKDAGFTLHATNLDTGFDQALTYVEAVGLQSIPLRVPGDFELPPRANRTPPTDRDAIVGWLLADEPSGSAVATGITEMNALMREDPTRWTFFNMLPPNLQSAPSTSHIIDVAAKHGMPIVSFDDYVIFKNGSELPEQFYGNLGTVRAASLANDVPFWAFAVTVEHSGYAGRYRRPSESDLRWMQFSNLAYGAKGLWYFTYWGAKTLPGFAQEAIVGNDGRPTELYGRVKTINETVLAMGDTLLSLRSTDVVHTNPPPGQKAFARGEKWISDLRAKDALVGFFEDPRGVPYALVVNKRHAQEQSAAAMKDTLELTFDAGVAAVEAVSWLDGKIGPLTITAAAARLEVAGGTGVLLRATRAQGASPGSVPSPAATAPAGSAETPPTSCDAPSSTSTCDAGGAGSRPSARSGLSAFGAALVLALAAFARRKRDTLTARPSRARSHE